jgi:hypothetical protein
MRSPGTYVVLLVVAAVAVAFAYKVFRAISGVFRRRRAGGVRD